MMTQTLALLLDAYRELNAKRIFWIVLVLNVVAMLAFAIIGVNDHTITILWFEPLGNMREPGTTPLYIYKKIFSNLIVGGWFTWLATGLALASTASIFPDFLASGSVDLYLSRPVGRLRLFLTKYAAGLLFAVLQVTVFTGMAFLILGFRAGMWEPGLLLAIPILVIFFSYLYGIQVLIGTWTRSTITALLLVFLAWGGIWGIDSTDRIIAGMREAPEYRRATLEDQIEELDVQMAIAQGATQSAPASATASAPGGGGHVSSLDEMKTRRAKLVSEHDSLETAPGLSTAQNVIYAIKTLVPKTRETTNLLDRVLFRDQELQDLTKEQEATATAPGPEYSGRPSGPHAMEIQTKFELEARARPVWWIIGTSLLFEAACVGLGAWIFCRRDF